MAIDNSSQNSYNNKVGGSQNEQSQRNQNSKNTQTETQTGTNDRDNSGRRGISFFNDLQRTRRIFEISRNAETVQRVKDFASMVYAKAENETQDALRWHAEKEDLTLYFAKKVKGHKNPLCMMVKLSCLKKLQPKNNLLTYLMLLNLSKERLTKQNCKNFPKSLG